MPAAPKKKINNAAKEVEPTARPKIKDPKQSHLYTDDNPETTIHGTGFKDEAAAHRTMDLIAKRSLLYQFQTVNTMWHRANGHPHKTSDMEKAMKIFREWLDVTYPDAISKLRCKGFKPLLSKTCVKRYLSQIRDCKFDGIEAALTFAERYVELEPRKKLANILFDNSQPREPDLEKARYDALDKLVPDSKETSKDWKMEEIWKRNKEVSDEHLRLIAWAWSPIQERNLP